VARATRAFAAVLVAAVIAAGAWLTRSQGPAPAVEERVVALPARPPETPPATTLAPATPAPATPPQTTPAPPVALALPAAPPAAPAAEPGADAPASLVPPSLLPPSLGALDGFGSARFDMTELEVREAIDRDFPGAETGRRRVGQIDVEADRVFLTRALLVSAREVLPGSGPARVEYVLGYQRHRLIQVNIIWGTQADPPTPRADVQAVATQLQDFVARAYAPNTRTTTVMERDGSVVHFVGRNRQGRTVELASSLRLPQRYWARLSYVQDPQAGDVYRLPRGAF
jgi:hypothetical protein